jgi:uncharacterized protein HemX
MNPDDPTNGPDGTEAVKESKPYAIGNDSRSSTGQLAGLRALAIVLIAGAGLALKKKLSRKMT